MHGNKKNCDEMNQPSTSSKQQSPEEGESSMQEEDPSPNTETRQIGLSKSKANMVRLRVERVYTERMIENTMMDTMQIVQWINKQLGPRNRKITFRYYDKEFFAGKPNATRDLLSNAGFPQISLLKMLTTYGRFPENKYNITTKIFLDPDIKEFLDNAYKKQSQFKQFYGRSQNSRNLENAIQNYINDKDADDQFMQLLVKYFEYRFDVWHKNNWERKIWNIDFGKKIPGMLQTQNYQEKVHNMILEVVQQENILYVEPLPDPSNASVDPPTTSERFSKLMHEFRTNVPEGKPNRKAEEKLQEFLSMGFENIDDFIKSREFNKMLRGNQEEKSLLIAILRIYPK